MLNSLVVQVATDGRPVYTFYYDYGKQWRAMPTILAGPWATANELRNDPSLPRAVRDEFARLFDAAGLHPTKGQ